MMTVLVVIINGLNREVVVDGGSGFGSDGIICSSVGMIRVDVV